MTYHHFRTDNHTSSWFIMYNLDNSLKSNGTGEEGGTRRLRDHRHLVVTYRCMYNKPRVNMCHKLKDKTQQSEFYYRRLR